MTTRVPLITIAEHYHAGLLRYLDGIAAGTLSEGDREAFGVIAGIYQIAISEENMAANLRHQHFAMRHFERQTEALERIAAALEARA